MGSLLTLMAFVASWWFGRRSLGAGMAVVLTAGYFFGIVRANYLSALTFFLYDGAVLGLYLARLTLPNALSPPCAKALTGWVRVLIGWPFVMLALFAIFPQDVLIQVVGLRAAIWYLPWLLLGASAVPKDLMLVARTLAVLNIVTLAFAVGEYFLGVERFYPKNEITALIYRSNDVAGHTALRIPATFNISAGYGGTMVATIPFLVSRWLVPRNSLLERWLYILGLLAAALGIFICGSRSPVVLLFLLGAVLVYHFRTKMRYLALALGLALLVGYVVSGSERLQRFTTLQDTDMVQQRLQVSVHMGILDLLAESPLGAGLGSAFGTNIPSFLMHLVDKPPIGVENEYARIGVEQGLIGMALWLAFLTWFFVRRRVEPFPAWKLACNLMLVYIFICWGMACTGAGMLASIPSTALLLFQMGLLGRDRLLSAPMDQPTHRDIGSIQGRNDTMRIPGRENKPCLFPG